MALQLESARFRGDPVLEKIRAADTTAYLKYGQSGGHIKAVQFALIDLGNPAYAIPSGATGFFGTETSNAVVKFKQAEGLTPADPVVGVGTITKLDGKWTLPNADRDEWLSWPTRPIPEFNFTRKNEMDRLSSGQTFTFNPVCGTIPTEFKGAITGALAELLDYQGSPDGKYSPSASWGASPFDFYHFHLAIDIPATGPDPSWLAPGGVADRAGKLKQRAATLQAKADLVAPQGLPAWTTAYRNLLLAPTTGTTRGMVDLFLDVLKEALANSVAEGQPLRLVWHTFEIPVWRPISMYDEDLRRHWRNTLFLAPSTPLSPPPFTPTPSNHALHYLEFLEPTFLVDQNSVITFFGPNLIETAALVDLDMKRVWDNLHPDPVKLARRLARA
ncbi:peptidoglycan-binding protein [Streptomyces sp. NPDC048340]|uniref:peptidoglycan-binding domain-containing protein n=1 Tax=Streptomyces sp. NPDC048340 TaxID=3365537 RepID=UPI0037157EFC